MATELIVFPDVLVATRTALLARLPTLGYTGIQVVEEVPSTRPARFVRLMRTGGASQQRVIDNAMLTVEAWATTPTASNTLAQAARAVINSMAGTVSGGVTVYSVIEFSGPSNNPDPISDTPRHTWTVEIGCRGNAA